MKKANQIKSIIKEKRVGLAIATLILTASIGAISINENYLKIGIQDDEEIYTAKQTTIKDFHAYIEMMNYEIEQDGGQATLTDVILTDGKAQNKSVIEKLNAKYLQREPIEITDKEAREQYKKAREVLMLKSENLPLDKLIII